MEPQGHDAVDADISLLAEVLGQLDGVEAALGRIDAGAYGRCATCATPLADATLEADPLAVACGVHA